MDETGADDGTRNVEAVFQDFNGRRTALIKALTTDVEEFWKQCDPENENLCLYGYPNEQWEVRVPSEVAFLPEPAIGINFARDETPRTHWLYLVAFHCDSWLLAVAFFRGARYRFCKDDRERLFNMINDLPTVSEIVRNSEETKSKEDEESVCGACGAGEGSDEFWILCDICEKWFHGMCVKITPDMAKDIQQYECPSCCDKKAQQP